MVINPAGYGHTSVALLDALKTLAIPVIECHLSNPAAREDFRRHTYVSLVATGVVSGFGGASYELAIEAAAGLTGEKPPAAPPGTPLAGAFIDRPDHFAVGKPPVFDVGMAIEVFEHGTRIEITNIGNFAIIQALFARQVLDRLSVDGQKFDQTGHWHITNGLAQTRLEVPDNRCARTAQSQHNCGGNIHR
jgi:hypothetical protein